MHVLDSFLSFPPFFLNFSHQLGIFVYAPVFLLKSVLNYAR